jgi:hypothetical protein
MGLDENENNCNIIHGQKMDSGPLDLAPQITVWLPQKRRAILWMLANFAVFRTNTTSPKTDTDYLIYLQSAFQTLYNKSKRMQDVGVYLSVLTMDTVTMRNWIWRKVPGVVESFN